MAAADGPVGLVLAGGASRRMGRDKTRLSIGGQSLPARAAERLRRAVAEVAVADGGRGLLPGTPSVPDDPLARGPVAGILGAARVFPGRPLLVLACDLPGVPAELLTRLAEPAADWVVPRHGEELEPLCALYGPKALAALAERVAGGLLHLWDLAETPGLAVRFVEGEELARFGASQEIFANLNTPDDLARWAG